MKVLHFYKAAIPYSKGGVEVFIDTLCKSTTDLGIKNTILTLADKPASKPIYYSNYEIYQVKQNFFIASTGFSFSAYAKLKILAKDADIIHYHFPYPFADLLHFACRIKKPVVITYHSDIIKQKNLLKLYRPLMNKFLNMANSIVATSPNYLASSDVLQKFSAKVSVIPIGLDKKGYPLLSKSRVIYWREKLPKKFFLYIGVMRYYKGLYGLLDAIKGTNIQLVLGGINGIENKLKEYAKQNKINNAHFLGYVSEEDKIALLNLCYGFVLPSHLRAEAFGIALLEGAAYSKPLISCEISTGTSYVNINNETGLVVNPSSPKDLKKAMQYLLQNPNKAKEYGYNAQKRYEKYFTASKQAKAYYRIYHDIHQK
ncbi:MAG: glycosyltransferase [SAR324 cluster bacterium]|nr:glycosyltransferase [SAR324 cluster bacterium]